MKRHFTLLLLFLSVLGYAQVGDLQSDGSRTVIIGQPSALTVVTVNLVPVNCKGGSNGQADLTVSGGTGTYSTSWDSNPYISGTNTTGLTAGSHTYTIKDGNSCTLSGTVNILEPISALSVGVTKTDIKCFGQATGAIQLIASGGNGNYTYDWGFPSQSGLIAGNYPYTVTDSKYCTITGSVTLTQPTSPLSVSCPPADITHVKCFGQATGVINLTVSGGAGSYSVSLDGGVTYPYSTTIPGLLAGTYNCKVKDVNGCTQSILVTITQPANGLTVLHSKTDVSCFGGSNGSIALAISEGMPAYTVLWNDGATTADRTNLLSGNYGYTVTDANGCSISNSITITQPTALTVNKSITNVSCFGGSNAAAVLSISGGTAPYTLLWNDGSNALSRANLSSGNYPYSVTDAKGCVLTGSIAITQPAAALTLSNTQTNVTCNGGSNGEILLNITGGTMPYTSLWNDGTSTKDRNAIAAGSYSVVVTDANGCSANSTNILITAPPAINIPVPTITNVTIFNQSTGAISLVDPTGGAGGYSYKWTYNLDPLFNKTTKNILGLKAGLYTLVVTDSSNCSVSQTFKVDQPDELLVTLQKTKEIACFGNENGELTANVTGGVLNYSYQWYKNDVSIFETTNVLKNIGYGIYKVIVTDSQGAVKTALAFDLKQPELLTVSLANQTNVLCYGANTGAININIAGGTLSYDIQWQKDGLDYAVSEDLTLLGAGSYEVIITDNHGCGAILNNSVHITQPDAPLLITDLVVNNLSGFETQNGNISVVASGGTTSYVYAWRKKGISAIIGNQPTLDKLPIGTYELTVTDNANCSTTKEYTLTQPDKLIITSITQEPTSTIKCYGDKSGVLKAVITGGVLPYTYRWYNVLTPSITASTANPSETLIAATYKLEVTDTNNNTFTLQSAPVIEPALLKIDYTQTNVSCKNGNDGTISIQITGGTGMYNIVWSNEENSNAISNLRAANYTVTVTDANLCQTSQTITISEPDLLYLSNVTKNPPTALGQKDGSIAITLNGGTPNYNYTWYNDKKELIYSDLNRPYNTSINNIYAGQYFITVTDAKGCAIIERDLDKVDPLFISINQINIVKCHGDANASIKANASGGTPVYYYKWYNTKDPLTIIGQEEVLTNIPAGDYYVMLSDSFGLSKQSETITVTEPTLLENSLASEYTRCGDANDWAITTTVNGGTAPYTYYWNTGVTAPKLENVAPANYSVIVTDKHGCTVMQNILITAPLHLATAEVITKPTCYEGSDATIVLTSSGGQAPYTYLWDTGEVSNVLSNASAKKYTVAVTDSKGCVINKSYTIENPPKDVINLGADVTLCFDQTLTINGSIDDSKASYSWISTQGFTSNKALITISQPADYTLVVTNKLGCKASDTFTLSRQETAIDAQFAVSSQTFLGEKVIVVDISNPDADSIEWILPEEATVISKNKDYAEMSFDKTGEYGLTLNTKKGNCTATQTKKILIVEGEYKNTDTVVPKKFDLRIYPNPSNGIFNVDVVLDKIMPAHVKVFNLTNNLIIDSKYEEGKDNYSFPFSLSGLIPGVYFVLFESQQGNQLRKIIIQ